MAKTNPYQLKKIQDKLVDEIITNPEKLEKIIKIQLSTRQGFHQYSLRNILLASQQLYERTGETVELLAPYKKWQTIKNSKGEKIHRHVKKGEKALKILIPYTYKKTIIENNEEKEETHLAFKFGSVFDLSQTEGDKLELDLTQSEKQYTLNEIISRTNIKVNLSNKEITRGYTNGKEIWISKHISTNKQICVYFHELAHYLLHFNENREELSTPTKELEAEAVSYIVSAYLGIDNQESSAYIYNWTKSMSDEKKKELLKGKGSLVLKTVTQIIEKLQLSDLINNEITTRQPNKEDVKVKI